MNVPDKALFVHQGALGDFLLAWPALWAVARWIGEHRQEGFGERTFCEPGTTVPRVPPPNPLFPKTSLWFVGEKERSMWTEPLGALFREPESARQIDRLYGCDTWPHSLEKTLVIWPGLAKALEVPVHDNLWFLPGISPGRRESPRALYLEALAKRGVSVQGDYALAFRELFAGKRKSSRMALLFPGAGHARKAWPVVKYIELAVRLGLIGVEPVFALGPLEVEQAVTIRGFRCERPDSLAALQELILRSAAVVGGDTGPMHLAGMLGVATLTLFGPTDPGQWAAQGARVLAAGVACAPCAVLAPDIVCGHGRCLGELTVDKVWEVLSDMVG